MNGDFLKTSKRERFIEISSATVLLIAAIAAMILANSVLAGQYRSFWHLELALSLPGMRLEQSLFHWINDGLMVLFFLLVSLEVKREITSGELNSPKRAAFPIAAAIGGMLVPAAIYIFFNAGTTDIQGWGVPIATDIVFALGVLMVLGKRVSPSLKVFLLTLAVVDDVGAIGVIAVYYTDTLVVAWVIGAILTFTAMWLLNRLGVTNILVYGALGLVLWAFLLDSGIHATITGVLLGLVLPGHRRDPNSTAGRTPVETLEHYLRPAVVFLVLPMFALANAGIVIDSGFVSDVTSSPITWGVALGLLVGKQVGIMSFAWLATRLNIACMPMGMGWVHVWGISWLAAIGFTVSMFISDLAFPLEGKLNEAHAGILTASLIAGLGGYILLRFFSRKVPAQAMKGTCR